MDSTPPRQEDGDHQLKVGWIGEDDGGRNSLQGFVTERTSWIPGPPKFPDRLALCLRSIAIRGIFSHLARVTGFLCGLRPHTWGGYRTLRNTVLPKLGLKTHIQQTMNSRPESLIELSRHGIQTTGDLTLRNLSALHDNAKYSGTASIRGACEGNFESRHCYWCGAENCVNPDWPVWFCHKSGHPNKQFLESYVEAPHSQIANKLLEAVVSDEIINALMRTEAESRGSIEAEPKPVSWFCDHGTPINFGMGKGGRLITCTVTYSNGSTKTTYQRSCPS